MNCNHLLSLTFTALAALTALSCSRDTVEDPVSYKVWLDYDGIAVPDFSTLGEPDFSGFTNDFSLLGLEGATVDHFAAQLEGDMEFPETGDYVFYLVSDDGCILYIDDKPAVNHDGKHGITLKTDSLRLEKGVHRVRADYFNYDKALKLEFLYSVNGSPLQRMFSLGDGIPAFVKEQAEETYGRYLAWKGDDETVVFPILTDVHTAQRETYKHISYVIGTDDIFHYDFMVNLGDIGLNDPLTNRTRQVASETVELTRAQMSEYDGVFLYSAGNHDWDAGEGCKYSSEQLSEWFQKPSLAKAGGSLHLMPGKCYGWYDLSDKGLRFIFLNSEGDGTVGSYYNYDEEQRLWLSDLLSSTPANTSVVLFSHLCPHPCGEWLVGQSAKPGSRELMDLLAEAKSGGCNILAVICGDSHVNACETEGGIPYFISQGYGGDMGENGMQKEFQKRAWFNYTKSLCCDIIAIKPATGEVRSFRMGAGGSDMDYLIN